MRPLDPHLTVINVLTKRKKNTCRVVVKRLRSDHPGQVISFSAGVVKGRVNLEAARRITDFLENCDG